MTLSEEVQGVLHRAFLGAREAGHAIVTPEHVALELILDEETAAYLERCGTDLVAVESRLRRHLERIGPVDEAELETKPSVAFQRVVRSALDRVESEEREHLMPRDLFIALIAERDGLAGRALLEATREPQDLEALMADGGEPANG